MTRNLAKALILLDQRIEECCVRETEKEKTLMQAQHALRCMAANLANDPYPEVLMHRLKAQVMEKNAAQRELDKTTAMVQQLKTQRRILQESELSSEVVFTLKRVLDKMQPHLQHTTAMTDKVIELTLDQREEVADVTRSLTHDLDDAFEISPLEDQSLGNEPFYCEVEKEVPSHIIEEESSTETELLMTAIRQGQRERLECMQCE